MNDDPSACIDDLLGPKARAMGIRCPCPVHTPPMPVEEKANAEFSKLSIAGPEAEPAKRHPHNGKMAAAHDEEEPDETG